MPGKLANCLEISYKAKWRITMERVELQIGSFQSFFTKSNL